MGLNDRHRRVLEVSLPLVASTGSTLVMEFTDRAFLANHSVDAIAAALPAGIAAFFFIAFFQGVAGYVGVFVAQYHGAGRPHRVGPALWQGLYFAAAAGVALAALSAAAPALFGLAGHPPRVAELETVYFRVLLSGAVLNVAGAALAGFFTGLGRTRPVLFAHAAAAVVNIPLDYALINGIGPWPVLGIRGAGIATVVAWAVAAVLLAWLVFRRENDDAFGVIRRRGLDPALLGRLLRYGGPGALQFSLDIFAFAFFVFAVGRIGRLDLAATNIALTVNALAFMPMMGISLGTSALVGQAVGCGRPGEAAEMVTATLQLVYLYVAGVALVLTAAPDALIALFRPRDLAAGEFGAMAETCRVLLRFVTVYIFFDAGYMVFTGALKGAGDTAFIMWSLLILSAGVMAAPLWIGVGVLGKGVFYAWSCVASFVFCLFAATGWRYRRGLWRAMGVVEPSSAA
jgi:MATE family multidrug resistance protein